MSSDITLDAGIRPAEKAHGSSSGVPSLETLKSMSGLEFMTAIAEGKLPAAPMAKTMGVRISEISEGRSVFRGTPTIEVYNPIGSVHGGWAGALLDSCMGCAIHTTLPAGMGYTTLEYKVNLVRGMTVKTGEVEAVGTIVSSGNRVGVAEGTIRDAKGNVLAHGTTTCLIFPL
jgi:uncharacterized protein (TIGR00369 family)